MARYGRLPNFGAFDWHKTDESIIALGLVSGSACLVKLNENEKPSQTIATFKLKQQRKCNSVALSTQGWLAVALDRIRSDPGLNIWDATADLQSSQETPIRRLCPAEVVSSVRWFPSHPQELIVAAQRSSIRIYDLRDGYFGASSNVQVSTRNVNNIAIDSMDENYFASAGSTGNPELSVWDKRWLTQSVSGNGVAVFDMKSAVDASSRTSIWSLRYSGQRRGRLAICSSRGELRVVDMVKGRTLMANAAEYAPANPHGGTPWVTNHYIAQTRRVEGPHDDAEDVRPNDKLIAFDWIIGGNEIEDQKVLALRPNRKVDVLKVPCAIPHAAISARHDLSIAFRDLSVTEVDQSSEAARASSNKTRTAEDFGPYSGEPANENEDEKKLVCSRASPHLSRLLAPATIQRQRCRQGYLFDCQKNSRIVAGDWQLERLWEIVNRFREQCANGGMVSESLDLSFIGVAGVCSEKIGSSPNRRLSPSATKIEDAIDELAASRHLPAFEGQRTNYSSHRQLCLEMCGWKWTTETLEEECNQLIERGLPYQAIVQAVLHERRHIALNILRQLIRSKIVPNIGLGALLASDTINEEQREMCMWMAFDTEDPALKALLTFLTSGDWRDVMKTNYLHLGYRVALGLKYLNDTELGGFIQTETARAVKNGDLEGLLLTGLGEQSMDLLQTYIAKTNDLQTAVLATAFTNPLFSNDPRWEMWKETYFNQMQSWRAFRERSQFLVQHSQMAKTRDGHSLLDTPAGQVTIRCNHCQSSLARHDGDTIVGGHSRNLNGPASSSGIICPKCGRRMPRCGICKLWLGTPDPHRRGGAKELSKLGDVMAKFLTFCVSCQHGFHADHAQSWFKKHSTCPVPDCRCLCNMR